MKKLRIIVIACFLTMMIGCQKKQEATLSQVNKDDIIEIIKDNDYSYKEDKSVITMTKDHQKYVISMDNNDIVIEYDDEKDNDISKGLNKFCDLYILNDIYRLKYNQSIPINYLIKEMKKGNLSYTYIIKNGDLKKNYLTITTGEIGSTVVFKF